MRRSSAVLFAAIVGISAPAWASNNTNEVEPNDSKATATLVNLIAPGDTITGNSTSASAAGLDYFLVRTPAQPFGIYRHRLTITTAGTAGHTGTIRGLNQVAAPPDTLPGAPWDGVVGTPGTTDATAQTSSTVTTPPRYNQWYTFGQPTDIYYRVTGTASTTENYVATWTNDQLTPVDLGTFQPGTITMSWIGQGHTTDTDVYVYDSLGKPISGYGNDDSSNALSGAPIATTSTQSYLIRDYTPGTYYLAVSNFNLANDATSPSDDNFRTGTILDFSGATVNSSTTIGLNLAFTITDSVGPALAVASTKASQFDVNWFVFTVVPEPATMSLAALALPALLRRRR